VRVVGWAWAVSKERRGSRQQRLSHPAASGWATLHWRRLQLEHRLKGGGVGGGEFIKIGAGKQGEEEGGVVDVDILLYRAHRGTVHARTNTLITQTGTHHVHARAQENR
jgi:hypothetical protein